MQELGIYTQLEVHRDGVETWNLQRATATIVELICCHFTSKLSEMRSAILVAHSANIEYCITLERDELPCMIYCVEIR